jgi:DHA1 family multidrug resistance protein-like MFS transporter
MHMPDSCSVSDVAFPRWRRSVAVIALGAGMASFSMNFWMPFLPVYMKQMGAADGASALTWVGIAYTGSGIARLVSGPAWGVLADRYGRKQMYLRALFAATITTLIAGAATEPWHVAVALTSQGLLSGFIPAAVALTSVSVPGSRLTGALGSVQGAQYAGNTVGPLIGALLAGALGLRGAVIAGALVPATAGLIALVAIPRDATNASPVLDTAPNVKPSEGRLTALTGGLSVQLGLGLLVFFTVHMAGGMVRTAAPIALEKFAHGGSLTTLVGWTFAAGGLASVVGALGLARLVRAPGRMRVTLVLVIVAAAAAHAALGAVAGAGAFVAAYAFTGLCQGAMLPATNTIIAAAVPHDRRGAAFGLASSVQALAFVAGPLSAAWFSTFSLATGFVLLGVMIASVAVATLIGLQEPEMEESTAVARRPTVEAAGGT